MKNPGRKNSDTIEYKPSKRKKSADSPVEYSTRWPDWEEQKQLGKKFREVGEGNWPAADILEERQSGKKKEYLVSWEPHPKTKEIWEPTWVPSANVNEALLDSWKNKNKSRTRHSPPDRQGSRFSNGQSVSGVARRPRQTRTVQDSSEIGSQAAVRPTTRASSSSGLTNGSRTPRQLGASRHSSVTPTTLRSSSPVEIAETQHEVSEPVSISISIPAAHINKADYESIHSSQIYSEGGLINSSPPSQSQSQSQILALNYSSQPALRHTPSKRKHPVLPDSSYDLASGQDLDTTSSKPTHRLSDARSRRATRSTDRENQPLSPPRAVLFTDQSPRTTALASKPPEPLNQEIVILDDSPASSRFSSPQYVPSTEQHSDQPREASEQLNSNQRRQVLSIAELTGEAPSQPRASPPSDTSPQQDGSSSTPWEFKTQALTQHISGLSSLEVASQSSNGKRHLFEGFRSPVRSITPQRHPEANMAADIPSPGSYNPRPIAASPKASELLTRMPTGGLLAGEAGVGDKETQGVTSSANRMDLSADPISISSTDARQDASQDGAFVPQAPTYDLPFPSALPIQKSIEEEPHYFHDEQSSNESKASSSQQSVDNERDVDQVDGLVQPSHPILGPAEYALALPAEGKVQSTYLDTINAKRKAILKFINRHESIGSSNGSPNRTHERNEMVELIQRLHDTTTHLDLGLPGFGAQYSTQSEHHAAYANYAGSKFSFLGHLVDMLKRVECSIIVMARAGPIQDLLEQYLTLKHINVRRQDRMAASKSPTPDRPSTEFQVHLVSTMSTHQVSFSPKPILMIAFDASFDSQDPQVMRIRSHFAPKPPTPMPVIHLLISNSSEHVDRCLPKSLPSPMRLKALVRATYQARPNLGGKPTYVPDVSDEPEGRPMDFSDLQRALRKSPERKLIMLASIVARASLAQNFDDNWNLGSLPELQLTEIDDAPPKGSGTTTVSETPKEPLPRSRTPVSRADTPSGRKRLLEVDSVLPPLVKRQRMTPLRDALEAGHAPGDASSQLAQLEELLNKLQADLVTEKEGRKKAEAERNHVQEQLDQWKKDHAALQRRYEKRMTKCHDLESGNKKLLKTIENNKARQERVAEDNSNLKKKVAELRGELTSVRDEIKAGGGDAAALEAAREEARTLLAKNTHLEKSLENTRKDFEFTRAQYQDASNKAAEFATQVRELEEKVTHLTKEAGDEKRRLKEANFEASIKRHLAKISELELERKSKDTLLRKLEEENRALKRNRGVQTRGSSVQPPGSPGLDGHVGRGPRSRPSSPAPGLFASGGHHSGGSNRGSLLRHER
ncbi:hypothetical protein A1O1_01992 [Capronia coronata CBS 617.96]|uniref:Chromo domain-containing protein n=1 Tax=Capronia coronata CBS 617.96 TaxID=1182541 RepID=W9YV90_9EURO|nr:uncharacterized protein A1O1_01992 [Capronia coronata CBS 617.96]EXJ93600.1 hypothetical protein A1O1_01992 [Capronia coronata CBS 617.96]